MWHEPGAGGGENVLRAANIEDKEEIHDVQFEDMCSCKQGIYTNDFQLMS